MYALVFGTKTFYPYLVNKQFVARLDHRSLVWLQNFKDPKPQEAQWIQHLQQYNMKIEHRPGHLHGNADDLSRRPWPENPVSDTLGEAQNFCEPLVVGATTSDGSRAFVKDGNESKPRPPDPPWSSAHLRTEQSKDKHFNAVLQWLKAGRRPPKEEMSGADGHMWALWGKYDRLLLQNEVLHRRWFDEKTGHESLQVCPRAVKGCCVAGVT